METVPQGDGSDIRLYHITKEFIKHMLHGTGLTKFRDAVKSVHADIEPRFPGII